MADKPAVTIGYPDVFEPLVAPARYKGAYGGRGSGKSWFFADALIERCTRRPGTRWLCVREIQKSLMESAKRLIEAELERFGLGEAHGWRTLTDRTVTPGGGVIIYQGMRDHTSDTIKSYEGFDGAWVEEAHTLSQLSLDLLRPTVRKEGSELWFSWNPRRKVDPVDLMFRGPEQPTNAVVVRANWSDNPWFPAELEQERLDCLRANPDGYGHIWDGDYQTVVKGAYFARQLAEARSDGRIGRVPFDPLNSVRVCVDIGGTGAKADAFAMWPCQWIGKEIRVRDYYEAVGQDIATHVNWLHSKGYTPDRTTIVLPHDGATQDRVISVSYESAFQQAGYRVQIVPNQGKGAAMARVERVRTLFPAIWIDEQTCSAGLEALGAYQENWDDDRGVGLGPLHNWASNGADAFGLMAIAYKPPVAFDDNAPRCAWAKDVGDSPRDRLRRAVRGAI
jgi:phage terminase large subunit